MREENTSSPQIKVKTTAGGVKIFRVKKVTEMVIYNIHEPHMGYNSKIPRNLRKTLCEIEQHHYQLKSQRSMRAW